MGLTLIYKGDFSGKPRMTQRDKWQARPATSRYWAFKDAINIAAKKQGFTLSDNYAVVFYIQMPKSWSKKKKDENRFAPHLQRPDVDNLDKGLKDALLQEDSTVWHSDIYKFWADENLIMVLSLDNKTVVDHISSDYLSHI